MSPELWNRVAELAGQAMDLPEGQRDAWVREQCGAQTGLLDAVLDLLAANREMGSFLDVPLDPGVTLDFGRYKVIRELGQGGMSIVYEGQRVEADFTQRVAIKLVLLKAEGILPESETRILSSLDHGNIARFLDAGITNAGFRYLVMEYIDGVACDVYCRDNLPAERDRLRLFLQICAGVQYANRMLVIHRDLKPGNILVTKAGEVKLLDFGIAKVLSSVPSQDRTVGLRAYTADYASPEQILGEPVTLATDVYSLGIILCELLGGARPRKLAGLSTAEAVDLVRQEIERVPLEGDLEQIVRKALRRDPAQRYESAAAMSQDIERYLQGMPVQARPATRFYRISKFVSRNRYAVAAATVAACAILASGGIALQQGRAAAHRFEQVRGLSRAVLFDLHDAIEKLPGSLAARQLLVKKSLEYLDALAGDTTADDALQLEVAKGYVRLADIEGLGNEPSLGQVDTAFPRLEKAVPMVQRVVARNPSNWDARAALYAVLEARSVGLSTQASPAAAAAGERLVQVAAENLAMRPADIKVKREYAHALAVLANNYTQSKTDSAKGIPAWLEATQYWRELTISDPSDVTSRTELARSLQFLAGAESRAGDRENARIHISEAYRMHKELKMNQGQAVDHMIAADVGLLANLTAQQGRYEEAIPLFEEQLRIRKDVAAKDPNNGNAAMGVGGTLNRLGWARVMLNRPAEAMPFFEESLTRQRLVYARNPGNVLVCREMLYATADLAKALEMTGNITRSCSLIREAAEIMRGPIKDTREMASDKTKKEYVRKMLPGCTAPSK